MLVMRLTTLPPATALLLSLYVSVCRGVRATHVCLCVFMHIRHVWLSCRSKTDEHRHLVESLVYPQGLQIQNSPDPGPRNNILNVTDCIKGETHAVGRTRIRNNTGWEEKVNILGKLKMSGSFLVWGLLLVFIVSCPIPSTLGLTDDSDTSMVIFWHRSYFLVYLSCFTLEYYTW